MRGPKGRRLCRWCGTEVEPPRRTFCGDPCIHEWKVRSSAQYAREQVFERDRGVCAICGTNTVEQVRTLEAEFGDPGRSKYHWFVAYGRGKAFANRLRQLAISKARWQSRSRGCWDMDHIVPVVEGGGSCGLDNLRTLCLRCHRGQTRQLRRRRTVRGRRKSKGYELF